MKVIGTRIAVLPDAKEETIAGGLLAVPEAYRKSQQRGVVLEVGDGVENDPMLIKQGQYVVYGQNSGIKVFDKTTNLEVLILNQGDVLYIDNGEKYKIETLKP
jgi:co-chaperonin GroES (HSP10)